MVTRDSKGSKNKWHLPSHKHINPVSYFNTPVGNAHVSGLCLEHPLPCRFKQNIHSNVSFYTMNYGIFCIIITYKRSGPAEEPELFAKFFGGDTTALHLVVDPKYGADDMLSRSARQWQGTHH
jgi:hypothetical protein